MAKYLLNLIICWCCLFNIINAAAIIEENNNIIDINEPRINSGEQLISTILSNCLTEDASYCLKTKVLNFMDTINNNFQTTGKTYSSRALNDDNIDEIIADRFVRALNTHEFQIQLPETLFDSSIITYRADQGIDIKLPEQNEGRGDMKKKLLLPVLLLLKLKMKVIMPILLSIIGLKAMKALILSKLAIKLVLGFLIYNLIQKLTGMKMMMMPAPEPMPMSAYGVPSPTTPASSYEPSSWDQNNGGPYSRVWDSNSAQNMVYSSYVPSSSSSSSSGSSSGSSPSSYSSYSS